MFKPIIRVEEVSKSFQLGTSSEQILHGISLSIGEGEFVSIMGPSGSGKSTLLYLIGGLDMPTSGQVWVNDSIISDMRDKEISRLRRQGLGFVFQFYNLIPNLNVEENILMPLMLDGRRAEDCRAKLAEVLERVGLTKRRLHKPKELSGGQQQRVAIARALITEPDIILADEPIGNLDSKTGLEVMTLLREINREQGKTIVQVTHSLEAAEFGNRIIFIKDGQVQG